MLPSRYRLCILLLLLALLRGLASAQQGKQIQVDAFSSEFPALQADIRIVDAETNRSVADLSKRSLTILEDGVELKYPHVKLTRLATDRQHPIVGFGDTQLIRRGAAIGIVLDLSTLQGDYNARAKEIVRWWLEAGRAVAPHDPERIGLFLPASTADSEPLQPSSLDGFMSDRNLVIVAMEKLAPRQGATYLYDAVLAAARATARQARRRGTSAYVLVVSDGGSASTASDHLDAIVAAGAAAPAVKLIAFAVGAPRTLRHSGLRLKLLAQLMNGAYAANPDQEQVRQIYSSIVRPADQYGYHIAFQSGLAPDRKLHTLRLRVHIDGAQLESEPLRFRARLASSSAPATPGAVLHRYLLKAVPIAMLLAALGALLSSLAARQPFAAGRHGSGRTRL